MNKNTLASALVVLAVLALLFSAVAAVLHAPTQQPTRTPVRMPSVAVGCADAL